MSLAYTTLKNRVAGNLSLNAADVERFYITDSLNAAQREILATVDPKHLTSAVRYTKGNLAQDQARYQWPTLFSQFVTLWVSTAEITDTAPGREVVYFPDGLLRQPTMIDEMPTTDFPIAGRCENGWELRPIPSQAVTNGWRLCYIRQLPTISGDQDCLLRNIFEDALVFRATALSASKAGGFMLPVAEKFEQHYAGAIAPYLPPKG